MLEVVGRGLVSNVEQPDDSRQSWGGSGGSWFTSFRYPARAPLLARAKPYPGQVHQIELRQPVEVEQGGLPG